MEGYYKFFNLKRIADTLPIQADKLYNNFKGTYNSLTVKDGEQIVGLLKPAITKLFDRLGWDVSFKKRKLKA